MVGHFYLAHCRYTFFSRIGNEVMLCMNQSRSALAKIAECMQHASKDDDETMKNEDESFIFIFQVLASPFLSFAWHCIDGICRLQTSTKILTKEFCKT